MLERLKARFSEPATVNVREADEWFREEREEDIAAASDTFESLTTEAEDALATLKERLTELEGYEDVEGRDVVEDVTDNIVADRRRMVDQFTVDGSPRELYEALDEFCDEFREMKRKETEVLKVIGEEKDPVFDALDDVKHVRDRLSSFLDGEYTVLERSSKLESACSELSRLEERRSELDAELSELDLAGIRDRIDDVNEELDALHDSDDWTEYQQLQSEQRAAERRAEEVRNEVAAAVTRMERGLKKLLYGPENRAGALEHRDVLEEVRDGDVEAVLDRDPDTVEAAVRSALDALPDDLLGERQHDKFTAAAASLEDIGEMQEELAAAQDRSRSLQETVESHSARERENELAARLDDLKGELEEERERRKDIREELDGIDEEMDAVEQDIRELLEDAFHREINLA